MKAKSNAKKYVRSNDDILGKIDVAANRFLFSFESYWKLSDADRRRWMALQRQIESEPGKKSKILAYVKERYGP